MVGAALKIKFNLKPLNLMNKEQLTPEYLKLNPQHTVPTLVDNNFSIWESRAIVVYLIEKYGKNDSLYPKDPKIRAVINQRFYFDMGTLFKHFIDYYFAPFHGKEQNPEDLKKLEGAFELLNTFLKSTGYAAGTDHLTAADLVLYASVSTMKVFDFDFAPYPELAKWLEVMDKTAPGADENSQGVEMMKAYFKK